MTTTTAGPQRAAARSDRPSPKTSVAEAVLAALADHPGATAEQLAAATSLGRSTVTKALAALDAEHRAIRSTGGRDRGRRLADRWSLPPVTTRSPDQSAAAGDEPGGVDLTDDQGAEGRLGRGELRRLVAECLAAEPAREFTAARLAAMLGRSAGAIGNALTRLVDEDAAIQSSASPRRYRHAPTGEAQ